MAEANSAPEDVELETFSDPDPPVQPAGQDGVEIDPAHWLNSWYDHVAGQLADPVVPAAVSEDSEPPDSPEDRTSGDAASGSDPSQEPSPDIEFAEDSSARPERLQETVALATEPVADTRFLAPEQWRSGAILFEEVPQTLRLESVVPSPVTLRRSGDGDPSPRWEVSDEPDAAAVATIETQGDALELRWHDQAEGSAAWRGWHHMRLVTDANRRLYFRPSVQADPIPIELELATTRLAWDLAGPLPRRHARLEVDFQLPEAVEFGWIEPPDTTSPRRTRGLAVFSLADEERVALAMRLDFRATARLTVAARFAARLDPGMPWQPVSAPLMETISRRLNDRQASLARQLAAIESVDRRADEETRRVLRTRRDGIEAAVEAQGELAERFSKLRRLVALLASAGRLGISVTVDWPDGEQRLLSTASAEPSGTRLQAESEADGD